MCASFILFFFCFARFFCYFFFCCACVYVVGILNYHLISKVFFVNYLYFPSFFPSFFAMSNDDETTLKFFYSKGFAIFFKNYMH